MRTFVSGLVLTLLAPGLAALRNGEVIREAVDQTLAINRRGRVPA